MATTVRCLHRTRPLVTPLTEARAAPADLAWEVQAVTTGRRMRKSRTLRRIAAIGSLPAMLACLACAAMAGTSDGLDPEAVFVQVSWPGCTARLTAAGVLELRDPRGDEIRETARIDHAEAVGLIDELLVAGISLTLDRYPASREHLIEWDQGTVATYTELTFDGGQVSVWIKAGNIDKRTEVGLPASPAVQGVMAWVDRFRGLVAKHFGVR